MMSDEGGIKSNLSQTRDWFHKKWYGEQGETAPLLNRETGTMEPPRRTTFRIVTTVIALVIALIVLGITIGFWVNDHEKKKGKKKK